MTLTPAAVLDRALDAAQAAAVAHPAVGATLGLVGPAGTGKSSALVRRALRIAENATRPILVSAAGEDAVTGLWAQFGSHAEDGTIVCRSLAELAFEFVAQAYARAGRPAPERIDDARAEQHFEHAGAELFALSWTEFVSADVDPEITGLRAPERFAATAFRLFRKLRASLVSPADFKAKGLRGATAFYGRPPNLASADLLMATPAKYRDSLRAGPEELTRQYEREVDLVKILGRLYESYVDAIVERGCLTPADAIFEAVRLGREEPALREPAAAWFSAGLVDNAQDLTGGQVALLELFFGDGLEGVTLAGDPAQSTRGFSAGARGAETLARAKTTIAFETNYRCAPAVLHAARSILDPVPAGSGSFAADGSDGVQLYRAVDHREEARYVAGEIAKLVANGTSPARIAVVVRNLACAHGYIAALLARNLPVDVSGTANLYDYPIVRDALAALWSAVDPFRHDYLLRNLEAPWLHLSDASIATLCGEPADPQPALLELPAEADEEARSSRWDRRRSVRLGLNVTRGDVDAELPAEARTRVAAFREARERWERAARSLPVPELARTILAESVVATLGGDARGRFDGGLVERLIAAIDAFAAYDPLATLADFLAYADGLGRAGDDLATIERRDGDAIALLDVEAAKGLEFDAVFIVDARAGAWPRYYVPDAFLFMPSSGMIPKENVGDASAARTAKFTYTLYRYKLREKYNLEERRAFYCAATRARSRLFVSASGRATRGTSTPEFLSELEAST